MSTESKPYLLFSLNSSIFGIETFLVQEVFFLPEVTPIAEAPNDIVGVINLRGTILPIVNLHSRLQQYAPEYCLNDSVVVLAWEDIQVGLVVNQIHQVINISQQDITTKLSYGRKQIGNSNTNFITGIAQVEADLVMLLNHDNLFQYTKIQNLDHLQTLAGNNNQITEPANVKLPENLLTKQPQFCPNATSEEKATFRERAQNLMRLSDSEDFTGLSPLAVVGLNGEYFGLDLNIVREFTDIRKVTPIPCCPNYIVGNMNLRGEILTLVDIRSVLNLPIADLSSASKAMVVHVDDLVVGITIDEVFDVMYLNRSQIMPVPAAVHSMNDEYLRGTAIYKEKIMGILELPKIMRQGVLTVDQEI